MLAVQVVLASVAAVFFVLAWTDGRRIHSRADVDDLLIRSADAWANNRLDLASRLYDAAVDAQRSPLIDANDRV